MHPFGGTPICPRCDKAVYAAEQIMGPGRRLYHKPCLTCMTCRKRLDSYSLVEHDQDPYCKTCHVKNFGTRDLRHANLPDRDDVLISPPTSPSRAGASLPPLSRSPPSTASTLPARKNPTDGAFETSSAVSSTQPIFRPTRTYSPVRPTFIEQSKPAAIEEEPYEGMKEESKHEDEDWINGTPSHTGRGAGGLPRTVALGSAMTGPPRTPSPVKAPSTPVRAPPTTTEGADGVGASGGNVISNGRMAVPLAPMSTGTRYGAAFSGRTASPMTPMATGRQWGGGTPVCPKCQKTVYFAEQVKAIGKTYHRNCLRCTGCSTSLDSSRLTEKDGDPYCKHCYGKLYGPAGSGYALLGKAGG